MSDLFPNEIPNWIDGREVFARSGSLFDKIRPHDGRCIARISRSDQSDIEAAVASCRSAQPAWEEMPPVRRGGVLHEVAVTLGKRREQVAGIVAQETGKSHREALGETEAAVQLGLFMAGEGQRLYGRTTTSGTPDKYAMTIRQPLGVAGLIIAANTPIANIAWKVFPALICGNTAVLKAAEDTPVTAWIFGKIALEAGLPAGVCNVVQGLGEEAGAPLVAHPDVDVISFTGSTRVGRLVLEETGKRFARVSLELGGKNPLLVCDDADLENATKWAVASAFSNAGQRCAAASRMIVFDAVYDRFRAMFAEAAGRLRLGPTDHDDLGAVINERQLHHMLSAVQAAQGRGARILTGGVRLRDDKHKHGFYMAPTILENVDPDDALSTCELFGPITCLYRAEDFHAALTLANRSPYGLTACIHTKSLHRAVQFTRKVRAGVAVVNAGTHGSEPHMPFGGLKQSGNGTREPGTEALDVYSEWKDVYINIDPEQL